MTELPLPRILLKSRIALNGPGDKDRASLEELRRGGIDALAFAIAVGPVPRTPAGVAAARAEADAKLAAIRSFIDKNSSEVALALTPADVRRLHSQGKIAVIRHEDESEAPNVTRELLRRGYDETQIAKIWGANFLRVFERVDAIAVELALQL